MPSASSSATASGAINPSAKPRTSPTRNDVVMLTLPSQRTDPRHPIGEGALQEPDIGGVADDPEAACNPESPCCGIADQDAEGAIVACGGDDHRIDGLDEARVIELAGDAEREGEIEVADPQDIDPRHRGD